jgi:hypothetical protein
VLVRYLKAQALVLAFGGFVGPLFLLIYFSRDKSARPEFWWMLSFGLLVTVAAVPVAVLVAKFMAFSAAWDAGLEHPARPRRDHGRRAPGEAGADHLRDRNLIPAP